MSATPARGSVGIASKGNESVGRLASVVDTEEVSLAVPAEVEGALLEGPVSGGAAGANTLPEAVSVELSGALLLHQ